MKLYVLIVAGGRGRRMGTDIPKQYLEIAGKPVLMHTIERFFTYDQSVEIIIVLPGDQLILWDELQKKYSFNISHEIVKGGTTRFFSVKNGLESIDSQGLVAIHDGVRPLVSIDTIKRCFETAEKLGNAIPVISPADTLRVVTSDGNASVDRMQIKLIQTPAGFQDQPDKKAYQQDYLPEFTDDATVLEKTGERINLVEGNRENIKITNPEDLIIAQSLFTLRM